MAANTFTNTTTQVPFAFVASGKAMPAGEYTVRKSCENVICVRHRDGATAFALVTRHVGSMHSVDQPRLIFVKKDGRLHLSEVRLSGSPGGEEIAIK